MYGCDFCVMDKKKLEEYCALTGEPTNGAVMCDFEFERCPICQGVRAVEQPKPAAAGGSRYIQTSIFGAAGEKQVKG